MIMAERRKQKRRTDDVRGDDYLIKRYEFLIKNARDIILTIRQRDRKILEANLSALKAYQYSIDELRSMTIDDLEAAEMKAQTKPHLDQDFNHGLFFETIHVRKNGETFSVEVNMQETMMGNEKILLSLVHDMSERGQSQEAVQESANNLRALLNAVTESLLLLDKDGTILSANEMFAKRMRVGIDKIIGANYYDLLPADTAEERRRQAEKVIQKTTPVRFEYILDKRCIDQVIYPVFDNKGEVARLAFFGADISRRREMEKELETMALNDQLTGLYNRRGFFTLATRELKRAQRSQSSLLLFFIDMDGLKDINDRFGHEEGDRALMAAAKILTNTFRISDIISRIGGDEYAILVVDADEALMEKLLLRLYRLINNFNARKTHTSKLALSIGHSVYDPLKPTTLDELISHADQGMYKMKKVKYHRA